MSEINGAIYIQFQTDKEVTGAQFKAFEKRVRELVDEFSASIDDAASECGFESQEVHSVLLDHLTLEGEHDY